MKRWLILLVPLLAGVLTGAVVLGLYVRACIDLFNPERRQISDPYFLMGLDPNTAEGFVEVAQLGHKLVLRYGEVGRVNITLQRQYTEDRLRISLRLYGIEPEFNEWATGLVGRESLPEGITYSVDPSLVELSADKVHSSTLTIAVRPDAQIGSFKLILEADLTYPTYEHTAGGMAWALTLEVRPSSQ